MIIARILGTVVSSQKDPRLLGKKLLIVSPLTPEEVEAGQSPKLSPKASYLVAVDTVDAGYRETVIIVQGSSARIAATRTTTAPR